jgi:hypothetical protein
VEPASCKLRIAIAKRLQLIQIVPRRDSTDQRQSPAGQAPLPDRRHHQLTRLLDLPMNNRRIFLPAETRRMFHWVLHVVLKNDPAFQGMGNWTS